MKRRNICGGSLEILAKLDRDRGTSFHQNNSKTLRHNDGC